MRSGHMHVHKAVKERSQSEHGWVQCVTPDRCAAQPARQSAHGGIVRYQVCSCGAIRPVEINGAHRNYAPWPE
jgi:hypothetical protein